jgi:hypothetical protein
MPSVDQCILSASIHISKLCGLRLEDRTWRKRTYVGLVRKLSQRLSFPAGQKPHTNRGQYRWYFSIHGVREYLARIGLDWRRWIHVGCANIPRDTAWSLSNQGYVCGSRYDYFLILTQHYSAKRLSYAASCGDPPVLPGFAGIAHEGCLRGHCRSARFRCPPVSG